MEIIGLDIIPGKTAPVVHASQYDVGRTIGVYLHEGSSAYTLTGAETVTASIRKPDGNVVVLNVANTSSDYVEIVTTEQATACHGANLCELKIEDGGDVIGTANFIMNVEKDPLEGGIASASEIDNLATQVAGFVATEVADQYDSANVIFDNTPTAGHGNGYAVTSEGVKNAIDALGTPTASDVSYDNTVSGLTATDVQDAIDEVNGNIPSNSDFSLSGLSDTDINTPSSGQVLSYDGGKWKNKNAEYKVGDTVNIAGVFSGFLTSSSKEITFSIPFNKPINSSVVGITFSGGWTIRSVGGTYLANNVALSTLGTINIISFSASGVVVQVVASTAFSETNNTPLAVQARTNVTATFTNS